MKKILLIVFTIFAFFSVMEMSHAETFVEGKYINGEYIGKDKNGKHYYATMQFIQDKNGNIVYCLEPFVDFMNNGNYNELEFSNYDKLNADQKRRIELLAYYGYGYGDRTDERWYAITQYLIWNTVDTKAKFYFTSTLNGKKIDKYREDVIALENDADNHDYEEGSQLHYFINYKENLELPFLNKNTFEVVESSYKYIQNENGVFISEIEESGKIAYKKISNYYQDKIRIYDSSDNQDLIKPGNVLNPLKNIEVKVQKGTIALDIRKDDSVYTVESDFTNTCYEILKFDSLMETVCTSEDELFYETEYLNYGEYTVRQISHGVGYKADENVYTFWVDDNNQRQVVMLKNMLIKNDIEIMKYACKDDVCSSEIGAKFEVLDKNGSLVRTIETNKDGYGSLQVGYGTYLVQQIEGVEGYSLVGDYKEKIIDEVSKHEKTLYNRYIVTEAPREPEEPELLGEEIPIDDEEVILPPKTSVDFNIWDVLFGILEAIQEVLKRILELCR